MPPKVSVIIPVYNVDKYIHRCLDSLFAQTLEDVEYIFVNDCSPDKSFDILTQYLEHHRANKFLFKIINNPINLGVSKSRQLGLEAATGEYIICCDPDDWVDLDYLEKLYSTAKENNADIVISDFCNHYNDRTEIVIQLPKNLNYPTIINEICGTELPILHGSLCNKVIHRSLFSGVSFPNNISYCEDTCVILQVLPKADNIFHCPETYYHYDNRPNTLSRVQSHDNYSKYLYLIDILRNIIHKSETPDWYENWLSYSVSIIINRIFVAGQMSNSEFKYFIAPYYHGINYNKRYSKWQKIAFKCASSFNYKFGLFMWKVFNKLAL